MKDIARDLGVSQMTVSKALRNHSDISEKTRERVLKRMRELNYQPDWIARSMVTKRTYLVGLVLPDLMHSFFAEVAGGVTRKLQPLGYQVVISNTEENAETERTHVANLINRKVDGFIIASAQRSGQEEPFRLLDAHEGVLDQGNGERGEADDQAVVDCSRQGAGVPGEDQGAVEDRAAADGVEDVRRQGQVQHFLVDHGPDDPGRRLITARDKGVQRVQVRRDHRVL